MFRFGLKNLKVWQKLALMGAVMSTSIPVILYLISTRDAATIDFAQYERYGNEYLVPSKNLYANAVAYRDLGAVAAVGQASLGQQLTDIRVSIDRDVAAIDAVHASRGGLLAVNVDRVAVRLNEVKTAWSNLKAEAVGAGTSATLRTTFVVAVGSFITQVGDSSNLILDPDIDTYYLMSAVVTTLPPLVDDLGAARSLVASVASRGTITAAERTQLAVSFARAQLNLDVARKGMLDSAFAYNASLAPIVTPDLDGAIRDIEAFQRSVQALLTQADQVAVASPRVSAAGASTTGLTSQITVAPQEIFAAGTTAIDQVFKLYGVQLDQLDRLIAARMARFQTDRMYIWAAMAVGIAMAILLSVFIARTLTSQINAILQVFQRLGMGDFRARATVDATDEIGTLTLSLNAMLDNLTGLMQSRDERDQMQTSIQKLLAEVSGVAMGDLRAEAEVTADMTGAIADSFNVMITELRRVIGQVKGATSQVTQSVGQLQGMTDTLAAGSDAQSAQIIGTSAAIEEMAVSIAQVSTNATSSAAVAEQARTNAQQGTRAVSRTIEGMQSIRNQVQETSKRIKRLGESSQEIGEIVQLIGDIADRTSILALNASIQAAMAGEAGRGFAVVAEEVERLADRSTEATKRIATLVKTTQAETAEAVAAMEDTTREVVNGSSIANEAGTALAEIQAVSDKLVQLIGSISESAQQQTRTSQQVAAAMSDISQVTRKTASGTRDAAGSIGGLVALAASLDNSVARFTLPETKGRAA